MKNLVVILVASALLASCASVPKMDDESSSKGARLVCQDASETALQSDYAEGVLVCYLYDHYNSNRPARQAAGTDMDDCFFSPINPVDCYQYMETNELCLGYFVCLPPEPDNGYNL